MLNIITPTPATASITAQHADTSSATAATTHSDPASPTSSSSSGSSPQSPLAPLISSTREALTETVDSVVQGEESVLNYYNDRIAVPLNEKISIGRRYYRQIRHRYPNQLFIGSVGLAAVASAPWGKFAMIRNAALTAIGIGWILFPATTTGLLTVARDRITGTQQRTPSQWREQGEIVVRQQTANTPEPLRQP